MTVPRRLPDHPGIRLTLPELLALRDQATAPARHRPATRRPGATPARLAGAGMDLREIRAYVPGDDPRRLDAAATARTGQPHIRTLHEDRDDTTLLIADFRAPMLWGTGAALRSVRGARALVRAGWIAAQRGGAVAALSVAADGLSPLSAAAGEAQMVAIAAMLAHCHDRALLGPPPGAAADSLAEGLTRAARLSPSGGRVMLATAPGAWQGAEAALTRLARRRVVTVALILDEAECGPPPGTLAISDGSRSRMARLGLPDIAGEVARLRALGAEAEEVAP